MCAVPQGTAVWSPVLGSSCGHRPPPWRRLPMRAPTHLGATPSPAGYRDLPHRRARRPSGACDRCGACGLPKLLPQSTLSEVSDAEHSAVARGAARRLAARSVLPRRLHAAARPHALAQGNPRVIMRYCFVRLPTRRSPSAETRDISAALSASRRSAHVGPESLAAPPFALSGHRRRLCRGQLALDHRAVSFLFPVPALATVFRAKYLAALRRAFATGQLRFVDGTRRPGRSPRLHGVARSTAAVHWIVYAKRPFAVPDQVLSYLGRYTHRVALSNDRLIEHRDGRVRFRWKDYADHDRVKILTLQAHEFLRRFLLHIVPRGFMRIRHLVCLPIAPVERR